MYVNTKANCVPWSTFLGTPAPPFLPPPPAPYEHGGRVLVARMKPVVAWHSAYGHGDRRRQEGVVFDAKFAASGATQTPGVCRHLRTLVSRTPIPPLPDARKFLPSRTRLELQPVIRSLPPVHCPSPLRPFVRSTPQTPPHPVPMRTFLSCAPLFAPLPRRARHRAHPLTFFARFCPALARRGPCLPGVGNIEVMVGSTQQDVQVVGCVGKFVVGVQQVRAKAVHQQLLCWDRSAGDGDDLPRAHAEQGRSSPARSRTRGSWSAAHGRTCGSRRAACGDGWRWAARLRPARRGLLFGRAPRAEHPVGVVVGSTRQDVRVAARSLW